MNARAKEILAAMPPFYLYGDNEAACWMADRIKELAESAPSPAEAPSDDARVTPTELALACVRFNGEFNRRDADTEDRTERAMRVALTDFLSRRSPPRRRLSTDAAPWLVRVEGPAVEREAEAATLAETAELVGLRSSGAAASEAVTPWDGTDEQAYAILAATANDSIEQPTSEPWPADLCVWVAQLYVAIEDVGCLGDFLRRQRSSGTSAGVWS